MGVYEEKYWKYEEIEKRCTGLEADNRVVKAERDRLREMVKMREKHLVC